MLPKQGTNTGVTTQPRNYNTNGDNDILSEAFRCITSSDLPKNQTLDNYSPPNIELLVGAINDLQKRVQELEKSTLCQEIVLNPIKIPIKFDISDHSSQKGK